MFNFLKACLRRPAEGEYRIVKKTRGDGSSFHQLQQYRTNHQRWIPINLYVYKDGQVGPVLAWSGADITLTQPTLQQICAFIEKEKQMTLKIEQQKRNRAIVKEEVVECCTSRKIN